MARLELINIKVPGISPISMVVEPGECIAVSGPSGSGKTRLLRILCDLEPHAGLLKLDGVDSLHFSPPQWRKRVGYLPTESRWWLETVEDHFNAVSDVVSQSWLDAMGFEPEVMQWRISRLSSGEKQRLAVLRLLANRPEALLLDEPTANLDAENTKRVERFLLSYVRTRDAACVWVSHSPEQIQRISSRRMVIADGKLRRMDGAPAPDR